MTIIRQHNIAQTAFDRVTSRENEYVEQQASNKQAPDQQVKHPFEKKKYGALAHKLPMLILQNGLAQATGFLIAKNSNKTNEHLMLLDDLAQVIKASSYNFDTPDTDNSGDHGNALHKHILGTNIQQLMQLTRLALDASGALRRYVQGVMHIDATGEEQQKDQQAEEVSHDSSID